MPRGVEQTVLDHRRLYRRNLPVHTAARAAFRYYRRFQMPSPRQESEGLVAQPPFPPIVVTQLVDGRYHLVCDFPVLECFSDPEKTECCIRPADGLNRQQIEELAWRSVMDHERIQECRPQVLAAKFLYVQQHFPAALIADYFPVDPRTGRPPRLKLADFSRACDAPVSTLNNFLPRLRAGGIADIDVNDIFARTKENPNE